MVDLWGLTANDLQDGLTVADNVISGTLKYVDEPGYVDVWNTNHFMALKFVDNDGADKIEVGIDGQVRLDEDMIAVIAVSDIEKKLKVIVTKGENSQTFEYALTGLTLQSA